MKIIKETRMNTHQTHLEDLVLLGKDGLNELNDKIEKFLERFNSQEKKLNLTQKIDGAPALFCWSKYPGYPDNSIALKGFTSGPQNAMSSPEQIDAKYGDRPDMAAKLKLGLQLAKYIPAGECWQGDCLFSHDDIREEEINGKNYLTFQPNKIVYAFSEENADYDKVANSDFGICFHTIYKDAGNGNKSQSFDVDPTRINAPNNFYIMSPAINVSSNKADYDTNSIEKEYEKLKAVENKLLNDSAYEDLINNQVFMNYWNTFENASLADKKQVNLNASTVINDLKSYVRDKQEKEYNKKIGSLKTDVGKQKATDKFNKDVQELADLIDNNKSTITNIVEAINLAANIKMSMWAGLKQAKNDYSTFYRSRTKGYFPAEGEGIAMSTDDGNIVKIVDRSSFSSYNRDPDIMSGFEHESLQEEIDTSSITFDSRFEKLLGNNKDKFIKTVIKMILDHTYLDYFSNGMYRENEYPADHTDAHGRNINQKLKKVHDFWLDNFGLDTSLRGVGSKIDSAIIHIKNSIKETDEYKDSLYWDDSNKLPADEKFKIDLFYEWDAIRKDPFGDYSDDDPRKDMSFREFLQYKLKNHDYDDEHEKQLLIDAIEEVKGGSGYFKEMLATQRGDMGSFNKFIKKLTLDESDSQKTAVVAFGRFNPPHIGHRKLAKAMADAAHGEKAKIYLSHKVNSIKDPLSYDSKLRWAQKEWGDLVDVVPSKANNAWEVLEELYNQGYTDIIYAGGEDRIGGSDDIYGALTTNKEHNEYVTKGGDLLYKFNSITPLNAGRRDPDSFNNEEKASASLLRKLVAEDNFDEFKKFVYLNEADAYRLFKELKYSMKGREESFIKAANNRIMRLREASMLNEVTSKAADRKHLKTFDDAMKYISANGGLDKFNLTKDDLMYIYSNNKISEPMMGDYGDFGKITFTHEIEHTKDNKLIDIIKKSQQSKYVNNGFHSGLKSIDQGNVEFLIADAFNNINDSSKPYHDVAAVLAKEIGTDVTIHKLETRDGGKATEMWRNAGAYGGGSINNTPKTDLISSDKKFRISLKKEGGSQLMSGKFSETGSEALATLNCTIDRLGKEYTLDDILNVSYEDDDVNGTFNVNEVLRSYYEDETLNRVGTEIGAMRNRKSGTDAEMAQTKKLNDISKKLKLFATKLQNMCDNDKVFREAFLREAATGEMKFGVNSVSTANCWFVYTEHDADFYTSWEDFYDRYLKNHKVEIQVNFKSGGSGKSAPYIVIRISES